MILVGQYDSPYVRRVAVTLHLFKLPFERNTMSVFGDAVAMRGINPLGRVPSLVLDDGEVLVDSGAILDHLEEVAGAAHALIPRSGPERRRALRLIALGTGAMDKAIAIVCERLLRPADKQYAPWLERNLTQLATALAALERSPLSPWLMGTRMQQPDITTACMIGYLKLRVPDAFPVGRYLTLERLSAAAEATPAFVATRPAADETIPAPPKT